MQRPTEDAASVIDLPMLAGPVPADAHPLIGAYDRELRLAAVNHAPSIGLP